MRNILEYLVKKHELLKKYGYNDAGGMNKDCTMISFDAADLLILEGRAPEIWRFSEDTLCKDGVEREKKIFPVLFRNSGLKWGFHDACYCEGDIYDPLIGEPVPAGAYAVRAFGEHIRHTVQFDSDTMKRGRSGLLATLQIAKMIYA